jgi:predicted  nucleic acid-binding Zn-ribbon protein
MRQAYRALANKDLTNENNPNTADYGDNRYIREDWYEILVTPQDLEDLAAKTQQKSPEEQKVSRALQQTNRRAKKDFSTKLAAIAAVSNQESPKANEIKKLENFLNRLERKMEDGKVSDFAISEEDRQEFRGYVETAKSKLGINEHVRRVFRRFV